jgi:endonuclease/exonuclease/phosphatase family metal-dependent hydrolase
LTPLSLSLATWNVHGFVGADGLRDTARVAAVLRTLEADVIALQEVDDGVRPDSDTFESLAASLGFEALAGPTLARRGGRYGNLLLTRHPVLRVALHDLSEPGHEPRGAIDTLLEVGGARVRIIATHLGLRRRERARQASRLCAVLDESAGAAELIVLLGDINEWRRPLWSTGVAPLVARFARRSRRRTFPARAPLFALDRVLLDRGDAEVRSHVVAHAAARAASDHLPLRARVRLVRRGADEA